jgi:hypothetical protein
MEFQEDEYNDETTIQIMHTCIDTSINWNKKLYEDKKRKILKANVNKIKGVLGEYISYIFLENNGFMVESYSKIISGIQSDEFYSFPENIEKDKKYYEKLINGEIPSKHWNRWIGNNALRKKSHYEYLDIIKKFGSDFMIEVKTLYNLFQNYGFKNNCPRYIPDFIALKQNKKYVVEVKSFASRGNSIPNHQKEALELSKVAGFIPIIVKIPIKIELKIYEREPSIISLE